MNLTWMNSHPQTLKPFHEDVFFTGKQWRPGCIPADADRLYRYDNACRGNHHLCDHAPAQGDPLPYADETHGGRQTAAHAYGQYPLPGRGTPAHCRRPAR